MPQVHNNFHNRQHNENCYKNGDENRCSKDEGHENRCDEKGDENRSFAAKVEGHNNRGDENRCSKDEGHENRCDKKGDKNRSFEAKVEGHENKTDENGDECDENGDENEDSPCDEYDTESMSHESHLGTCSKFHSFSTNECLPQRKCVLRQCPECGVENTGIYSKSKILKFTHQMMA